MAEGVSYIVHGKKVIFPCKAYPTQLSMMDRILKGLENRQHCLLESPTGSGKSLALLCSCLAWQCAEYEKAKQQKIDQGSPCSDTLKPSPVKTVISPPVVDLTMSPSKSKQTKATPLPHNPVKLEDPNKTVNDEEEGDFKSDSKRFRTPIGCKSFDSSIDASYCDSKLNKSTNDSSKSISPPEGKMEIKNEKDVEFPYESEEKKKETPSPPIIIPKIYFGTRTHKQVSQIARELRKTVYKHTKMCILSSREHTCIHPVISKNSNKNEECRKLLDPSVKEETCFYYQKISVIGSHASIKSNGLAMAWDIEDFVRLGKKSRACPYYAARELMTDADIIFCPYNYLIDPKIRHQMNIDLKDQIVILDEAHNIEDSARESASLSIDTLELQEILDDLDKMIQWGIMTSQYHCLHAMCASIQRWMGKTSEGQMRDTGFEQAVLVLSGENIFTGLKEAGLTNASLTIFKTAFEEIMSADRDPDNDFLKTSPTSKSVSMLEGLFLVLSYVFGYDGKFVSDYRVTILKTAVFVRNEAVGTWKRAGIRTRKEWKYSLNIWCFNPAVVFSHIGEQARSIILTSGTLSPMTSFASELGVPFHVKLEANHVIANSQVWVGSLAAGPSGSPVNATYRFAETFSFQDDIGNIVLEVCEKIPHGVLCFFPSYNMLEKVSKRWQSTGLWAKLLKTKIVLSEPRGGSKADFDDIMHEFYSAIRRSEGEDLNCTDSDDEHCCDDEGALFLAVCRGKVSEGLDFADNNARAVISIGIPFPNTKDLKIGLKRKYNDSFASKRGLLNGSEWYEIQAFRALNQALGRCIRHKQDWGAILLVDERFSKFPRYSNGISKWVRQRLQHYREFKHAVDSLKNFADARQLVPCPGSQTAPLPSSTGDEYTQTKDKPSMASNDICTPLTYKKHTPVNNQSSVSSPVILANRFADNTLLTPCTNPTQPTSIIGRTNSPSTSPSQVTPLPSTERHATQCLTQYQSHTTLHHAVSTPQVRNQNGAQQNAQSPMSSMAGVNSQVGTVQTQGGTPLTPVSPRFIFISNNPTSIVSPIPHCALRPITPSPTTRPQQVLYFAPIRLNGQATNLVQLPKSSQKDNLLQSHSNSEAHLNQNHVVSVNQVTTEKSGNCAGSSEKRLHFAKNENHETTVETTITPTTTCVSGAVLRQTESNQSKTVITKAFVYPNGQAAQKPSEAKTSLVLQPKTGLDIKSEASLAQKTANKELLSSEIEKEVKEESLVNQYEEQQQVSDFDMASIEYPESPTLFSTPSTEDSCAPATEPHDVERSHAEAHNDIKKNSLVYTTAKEGGKIINECISVDPRSPKNNDIGENSSRESLRCKQCNCLLYQGQLTKQAISCQELTKLCDKLCNVKRSLSKKRKRNYSGSICRDVRITPDMNSIPDTMLISNPLQGEVFNALYKDNVVYIPIECRQCCILKVSSVIGLQVVRQMSKQCLFFDETVF